MNNNCNRYVPGSGLIPKMILALPWSQSDNNNNSAIFVRLLKTNPKSPGRLCYQEHYRRLDLVLSL